MTTFAELGLAQPILDALIAKGYTEPTPVQNATIPLLMARRDVMASAATGTGKTAAFMLPALHLLTEKSERPGRGPRILVLSPTRELAAQIKAATETYGRSLRYAKVVSIVGGLPYPLQLKLLSNPFEILVATPGRLIDLMERGKIDLGRMEMLVLDEADRMLDLGFRDDIAYIADKLPKDRVTALFSATLDGEIIKIAQSLLNNPERVEIAAPPRRTEQIAEKLHYADDIGHKAQLLERVLGDEAVGQAIVFTATKADADTLSDKLLAQGMKVAALHGDMQQRERTRTLSRLQKGEINVLVATDVAARGIDVAGITHVVNFDLPKFAEDYVHRIGRTGRAGRDGIAISFAARHEVPALKRIEKFIGRKIEPFALEGLEARFSPRPDKPRGDGRGGRKFEGGPRKFGGGRRFDGEGSRTEGERKPLGERRSYGSDQKPAGERRAYGDQKPAGERRTYADQKPAGERRAYGEQKPYGDRKPQGERKAYGEPGNSRSGERKPQGGRDENFGNRKSGSDFGNRRSYADDNFGNRAPRANPKHFAGLEADATVYHEQPHLTLHQPMGKQGQQRKGAPGAGGHRSGGRSHPHAGGTRSQQPRNGNR